MWIPASASALASLLLARAEGATALPLPLTRDSASLLIDCARGSSCAFCLLERCSIRFIVDTAAAGRVQCARFVSGAVRMRSALGNLRGHFAVRRRRLDRAHHRQIEHFAQRLLAGCVRPWFTTLVIRHSLATVRLRQLNWSCCFRLEIGPGLQFRVTCVVSARELTFFDCCLDWYSDPRGLVKTGTLQSRQHSVSFICGKKGSTI